jgi:hypothetical protein
MWVAEPPALDFDSVWSGVVLDGSGAAYVR